jgi:hypothetical protein
MRRNGRNGLAGSPVKFGRISGIYFFGGYAKIPIIGTARATEGVRVRKHGRTTGYTEGVVTDESYDALVGMDHSDPDVVALFESQMRIERIDPYPTIGLGGDSGSLVVMQAEASAVGLYFAGPPSGTYGVANHLQDVFNEMEIQLL